MHETLAWRKNEHEINDSFCLKNWWRKKFNVQYLHTSMYKRKQTIKCIIIISLLPYARNSSFVVMLSSRWQYKNRSTKMGTIYTIMMIMSNVNFSFLILFRKEKEEKLIIFFSLHFCEIITKQYSMSYFPRHEIIFNAFYTLLNSFLLLLIHDSFFRQVCICCNSKRSDELKEAI